MSEYLNVHEANQIPIHSFDIEKEQSQLQLETPDQSYFNRLERSTPSSPYSPQSSTEQALEFSNYYPEITILNDESENQSGGTFAFEQGAKKTLEEHIEEYIGRDPQFEIEALSINDSFLRIKRPASHLFDGVAENYLRNSKFSQSKLLGSSSSRDSSTSMRKPSNLKPAVNTIFNPFSTFSSDQNTIAYQEKDVRSSMFNPEGIVVLSPEPHIQIYPESPLPFNLSAKKFTGKNRSAFTNLDDIPQGAKYFCGGLLFFPLFFVGSFSRGPNNDQNEARWRFFNRIMALFISLIIFSIVILLIVGIAVKA